MNGPMAQWDADIMIFFLAGIWTWLLIIAGRVRK